MKIPDSKKVLKSCIKLQIKSQVRKMAINVKRNSKRIQQNCKVKNHQAFWMTFIQDILTNVSLKQSILAFKSIPKSIQGRYILSNSLIQRLLVLNDNY